MLDKLKATPWDCKAFLLAGSQGDDFQAARPEINEGVAAHKAAFQNGFDRKSQGVIWRQPSDSTILHDDQQLAMRPLALSPAELEALADHVNGDATQHRSGRIKLLKIFWREIRAKALGIEREHIQFTDQVGLGESAAGPLPPATRARRRAGRVSLHSRSREIKPMMGNELHMIVPRRVTFVDDPPSSSDLTLNATSRIYDAKIRLP